jgi:outer membrane protein
MSEHRPRPVHRPPLRFACLAVAAALAVTAGPAAAQEREARRFSLDEARDFAVEHSFETTRSGLDLETARQRLKETVAIGLPQVVSSVSYSNNLKLATSLIPNFFEGKFDEKIPVQFGTQHNASANIQVQQLLFNGSYFVGLQTSSLYRQVAEQGLERTRLNVRETVGNTYALVLVTAENERVLSATLANVEKTAAEVRELNREGFVADTDADLLQITVNQLGTALRALARQREIAGKLLKFQLGLDLEAEIELTDTLDALLARVDAASAAAAEFDPAFTIDFRLAEGQARLAGLALKNEKAKYWPTVSAFFTYQQNAYRDAFSFFGRGERWFPFQILGVNISLPLFRSGGQAAKVKQAELAAEQAWNGVIQVERGLRMEAEQARARLTSAAENFDTAKANMELAARVYEASLEKYREGFASSMELTQASDKSLQAQSGYIQALAELLTAKNRLDRIENDGSDTAKEDRP